MDIRSLEQWEKDSAYVAQLRQRVAELTAERDELNAIVESIGNLHHVTLDEYAAMKAERDELLTLLEDIKYLSNATAAPMIEAAIAKLKGKQNDPD